MIFQPEQFQVFCPSTWSVLKFALEKGEIERDVIFHKKNLDI